MGFSDKMREGLGAEGARLSLQLRESAVQPGATFGGALQVTGGTKAAHVDALIVRLIQARRQWRDEDGNVLPEEGVGERPDRRRLEPVWERSVVHERTIPVERPLEPETTDELSIELPVPEHCPETTLSCTYMLNVQAQIKGQIDPSTNANVIVGDGTVRAEARPRVE